MENYTREQLRERWEKAKENMSDPETVASMALHVLPGIWEVKIFPRWLFGRFLDRKIFEPHVLTFPSAYRVRDNAIMSRNVLYDPDSDHTQEWGWYRWRYYFDTEELCYLLELDYNVDPEGIKPLPLVKGILDLALVETPTSIIGKFKWRSPLLQRIPLIRRIPFIKAHRFLFYFEMKKIEEAGKITSQNKTGYARHGGRNEWDRSKDVITFPKGTESWGKVMFTAIFDPRKEGKCILVIDDGDGETFTGEDDTCFQ